MELESDLVNPRMAEPSSALVPCFRCHHVGGPNLLFHLARRTFWQAGEAQRRRWTIPVDLDGSQRRLLYRRQTEIPGGRARASSLVSLGSTDDLAEWNGADVPGLLFQLRAG